MVPQASPVTTYHSVTQSLSSGLIASRLTIDFNIRGATQAGSSSIFWESHSKLFKEVFTVK